MKSWEALNPAPWPQAKAGKEDPRIAEARKSENGLKFISPDFFAIHPVEYNAPEEDILLLDMSFRSTVAEATMHVPTYSDWIAKQDQTPAYEFMDKLLKLLQWQQPAKRWVLKSPHHLEFLGTFTKVFPDTRIIWPHRDPLKTMVSFFSMVAHSRYIFSNVVLAREVADHWGNKIAYMLDCAMKYRDEVDGKNFFDLRYEDLIADSQSEIKKLYDSMDEELTAEAVQAIIESEKGHGQHRYGKHEYKIEDFDMTQEELEAMVRTYRERFGFSEIKTN